MNDFEKKSDSSEQAVVLRNAKWIIAWDGREHVYLRDSDVAFVGSKIVQVGGKYHGPVKRQIDASSRLVMPGLVNVHAHCATEPLNKGFRDEIRSPGFWHSPLYEFLYMVEVDAEGALATVQVALGELLLSGVTTAVHLGQLQLGVESAELYRTLARIGIRVYLAPMFRDAKWVTRNGSSVEYAWDLGAGRSDFEKAKAVVISARNDPSGRLFGMIAPGQIDTCSEEIIREAYSFAELHNLPYQIHIAQSPSEFHEIARRTGKSPVAYLHSLGALGERTVLGHAIFLDHHPWLHWSTKRDLALIASEGASVAHCPVEFLRRGMAMHTLGDYIRRGINVAIGTDTYPHNMLEEMRMAAYVARVVGESVDDISTSDVFNAATIGGARALLREDIGRLAVGCRADVVLVDLDHPSMRPCREPLRSLIYVAAERSVSDVFVDGEQVVQDGRLSNIDLSAALSVVDALQKRGGSTMQNRDWAKRDIDALAPMALPVKAS